MNRKWNLSVFVLTGIGTLTGAAFAQNYTISAKPGALNFVEGDVTVNGDAVWTSNVKTTFLNAGDVIAIKKGRAEVLLAPGVFLRLGDNSEVRMIQPSLVDTQLEIKDGESMIEVDDLVPGSRIDVQDHGATVSLLKSGLYRFDPQHVAVLEGKADLAEGDRTIDVKKNKEVALDNDLAVSKIDLDQPDELYAWSNTRAQYSAAASYAASTKVSDAGGYGNGLYSSPGWYWNEPLGAYAWLPSNGAFYSPFGWGFYGPGLVAYAPVVYFYPSNGYYTTNGVANPGKPVVGTPTKTAAPRAMFVPVNPRNVGIANFQAASPGAYASARSRLLVASPGYGTLTASGHPAANLSQGQIFRSMSSASHAAAASARTSSSTSSGFGAGSGYRGGGGLSSAGMSSGHSSSSGGGGHK